MSEYTPTIGLEIHAELKTNTKMFCNSKNDPDEKRPNVNICPVCMAHPGTLPVINKQAVKLVMTVGKALQGTIADFTEFDRKNYFYPDIPKGYQISQYKYPIVANGSLNGVDITRVHLEEDTARSSHDAHTHTLVDFNRGGIPLMELVTEPVIKDAAEAGKFARELQLLLRYLEASNANMEKGEMRVEANVSVSKDPKVFGTKVEVKNLNSFKVVEKAIEYEIARQIKVLEGGGEIVQETRGWDEAKQKTFSQREKESSHDYRYFPDPDLPKLKLSEIFEFQDITLPELPWEKRERYTKEFGIKDEDIESYVTNIPLAAFFENVASYLTNEKQIKLASNYITSDILGLLKLGSFGVTKDHVGKLDADDFADLICMAESGEISSRGLKEVLPKVLDEDKTARELAEEHGLFQKSDEGELKDIVQKIISENDSVVQEYKGGKEASLQFLIGQGMKETKGSANPQVLAKLFTELIG